MAEKGRVCVTGAGGYVASWLVKLLPSRGYRVHGTVREPGDVKNAHLKKLDNALENLQLFKADLLDYSSIHTAIVGCDGVFHAASPVPSGTVLNPEVELIEPAVTGTLNVLKACSEAKVKRVVIVSSIVAVRMNPNWPKNQLLDETCWSDKEYCRETKSYYSLSKTVAESEAWEYAKQSGLDVVTVCPTLVIGPMLQSTLNSSSRVIVRLLKDGSESVENRGWGLVDVRDITEALLLAYEKHEAEGRYVCSAHMATAKDLVDKLRSLFPNYSYPKIFTEVDEGAKLSSEKLQRLGLKFRPLEETLVDSVKSYQESGLLD
ncbi:cinnamoyl-CoA reductase 1-like isoform X2 [Telopea speciosissima]|uniref:cinnamoyl-CoA reductase 1-like isoform X2 n=1 Tax=Telopea speciosissima TaxID=54955 RepID=UPI001CC80265|nr:cinnamoyl-CoA reductase 1-like isoform X2 [Telopea speciosissima]